MPMTRLRRKNNPASTPVLRDRNVAAPRAPNTVPESPPPKPEPACAPAPRCRRISTLMPIATSTYTTLNNVSNIILIHSNSGARRSADGEEILGDQRCAAYQATVDVRLGEQFRGIGRFHAAAVQDAQRAGNCSIDSRQFATNEGVDRLCLGRRRGTPGPDRPDRLIGHDRRGKRRDATGLDHRIELLADYRLRGARIALLERFADAQDRNKSFGLGPGEFRGYAGARLAMVLAPFGMPHEHMGGPDVPEHAGGNLAGDRALCVFADILRAKGHRAAALLSDQIGEIHARREDRKIGAFH